MHTVPAGPARLEAIYAPDQTLVVDRSLDNDRALFITRVADILAENATDGAIYVEVRFGAERLTSLPEFMRLFRQAEQRVQADYPKLHAEATAYLEVSDNAERIRTDGLRRIGHGTHVADDPRLVDDVATPARRAALLRELEA
jgi:hypothetical protein